MNIDKLKLISDDIICKENVRMCKVGETVYFVTNDKYYGPYTNYSEMCSEVLFRGVRDKHLEYIVTTPKGVTILEVNLKDCNESLNNALKKVIHRVAEIIVAEYDMDKYASIEQVCKGVIRFEQVGGKPELYSASVEGMLNNDGLGVINIKNKQWVVKGLFSDIDITKYIKTVSTSNGTRCTLYDFEGNNVFGKEYTKIEWIDDNIFSVKDSKTLSGLVKAENGKEVVLTEKKYELSVKKDNLVLLYYKDMAINNMLGVVNYLCDVYSIRDEKILNDCYIMDITASKESLIADCARILDDDSVVFSKKTFNTK